MIFAMAIVIPWLINMMLGHQGNPKVAVDESLLGLKSQFLSRRKPGHHPNRVNNVLMNYSMITKNLAYEYQGSDLVFTELELPKSD